MAEVLADLALDEALGAGGWEVLVPAVVAEVGHGDESRVVSCR